MYNAKEIKKEIAERQNIETEEIRCSHCRNWAYNCGGVMTSIFTSKCRVCGHKTVGNQFCKKFVKTLDKIN